jgi:phage terminase Nu1 subunit (DNA packaging protein)
MTADELCEVLKISRGRLSGWKKEGLPCERSGRAHRYSLRVVRQWMIANGYATQGEVLEAVRQRKSGVDPDMTGGPPSEAQERFRLAKAQLAELDLAERRKQLVVRDAVHLIMEQVAGVLRTAGDTLQKRWGAEARRVLTEATEDAERLVDQLEIREEE